MSLKKKVHAIFNGWFHEDSTEEKIYKVALDLIKHGYSEDEAVSLLKSVCGAISWEYSE